MAPPALLAPPRCVFVPFPPLLLSFSPANGRPARRGQCLFILSGSARGNVPTLPARTSSGCHPATKCNPAAEQPLGRALAGAPCAGGACPHHYEQSLHLPLARAPSCPWHGQTFAPDMGSFLPLAWASSCTWHVRALAPGMRQNARGWDLPYPRAI